MPDYSEWLSQLEAGLTTSGSQATRVAAYLRTRGVRLGIHAQPTGARWTIDSCIQLHPRFASGPPDAVYPLSLVIHEARHIQQGMLFALSVYGELDAWHQQFKFLKSQTGRFDPSPPRDGIIAKLMSLRLGWRRQLLITARDLMLAYAGPTYRIDLLPLYPLHREMMFRLTGHVPLGRRSPSR